MEWYGDIEFGIKRLPNRDGDIRKKLAKSAENHEEKHKFQISPGFFIIQEIDTIHRTSPQSAHIWRKVFDQSVCIYRCQQSPPLREGQKLNFSVLDSMICVHHLENPSPKKDKNPQAENFDQSSLFDQAS